MKHMTKDQKPSPSFFPTSEKKTILLLCKADDFLQDSLIMLTFFCLFNLSSFTSTPLAYKHSTEAVLENLCFSTLPFSHLEDCIFHFFPLIGAYYSISPLYSQHEQYHVFALTLKVDAFRQGLHPSAVLPPSDLRAPKPGKVERKVSPACLEDHLIIPQRT